MIEIIPTNTCPPDSTELTRRSEAFAAFAPLVQLDVADGKFVPARSWPYGEDQMQELATLPGTPALSYEVHLMVEEPQEIGIRLARAGASRIIGHIEAFAASEEVQSAFDTWRSAGAAEVGLAVLFQTPLSALQSVISSCDVVQLMSIAKLGYQGAPFEPGIFERIKELHAAYPALVIEIDGGVSEQNIEELVRSGARRFGVGSAISKAEHPRAAYERLKKLAESVVH